MTAAKAWSASPRVQQRIDKAAQRRAAIAEHYGRTQNAAATAREFRISRERVRQIVAKESKP